MELFSTRCAGCNVILTNTRSITLGLDALCREAVGFDDLSVAIQVQSQPLIYEIAALRTGFRVEGRLKELRAMGLHSLAARIDERIADTIVGAGAITDFGDCGIVIKRGGGIITLSNPFPGDDTAAFLSALREIPGRRWDNRAFANTFPESSSIAVYSLLKRFFKGMSGTGPKGPFLIGETDAE